MKTIMIQVKVQIQNLAHIGLILIGAQQKLTIAMMKIPIPGWVTIFFFALKVVSFWNNIGDLLNEAIDNNRRANEKIYHY